MDPRQCRRSSDISKTPLRPLLPAAAPRTDVHPTHSKRARVSLACSACRSRKTKVPTQVPCSNHFKSFLIGISQCDGGRARCSECISRSSDCQYTETETTQTKRRHADLEELFELMKNLPEEEAYALYGRIRAGVEPRELVEQVHHGSVLVQLASASASGSQESRKSSLSSSSQAAEEVRRRGSLH